MGQHITLVINDSKWDQVKFKTVILGRKFRYKGIEHLKIEGSSGLEGVNLINYESNWIPPEEVVEIPSEDKPQEADSKKVPKGCLVVDQGTLCILDQNKRTLTVVADSVRDDPKDAVIPGYDYNAGAKVVVPRSIRIEVTL